MKKIIIKKTITRFIAFGLAIVIVFTPLLDFISIASVPKADAQAFNFLPNPAAGPLNEEPNFGRDCGFVGFGNIGIPGECIPIKVDADPYRFDRNTRKSLLTYILVVVAQKYATWLADKIDSSFRINDYLRYAGIITNEINRNRFLFENLLDPLDRYLTSVQYDDQTHGWGDFGAIGGLLQQKATLNTPPYVPGDQDFYSNLALSGSMYSTAMDWFHQYNDKALQTRAEASRATTLEILTGEGYKSTRNTNDMNGFLQSRTLGYFSQGGCPADPVTGQPNCALGGPSPAIPIMTPGGYAAKAIQELLNQVVNKLQPNNNTNVSAAALQIANIILSIINGGVFRGGTQAFPDTGVCPPDPVSGLPNCALAPNANPTTIQPNPGFTP